MLEEEEEEEEEEKEAAAKCISRTSNTSNRKLYSYGSVSYTHLTLPTNREV